MAIHPPSVENSTLSGSWPIVNLYASSSRTTCRPAAPASMQAMRLTGSIHKILFIRRMSTETMSRSSVGSQRRASVTLVPPPKGMRQTPSFFAISTSATTSSCESGQTTTSGTRGSDP